MRCRVLPLLSAVMLSAALAACSSGANPADVHATSSTFTAESSSSTAAPNTSVVTSPSPGAVTSGDKVFNFVVPSGWNLSTNPKAVAYLSSATEAHNVSPTIAVTKSAADPAPALDETLQMAMMKAKQDGAVVGRIPSRTIGGATSMGFHAATTEKNVEVSRTYQIVAHEKSLYVIVLTTSKADAKESEATLNSVLSSWTWSRSGDKNSTASGTTPPASSTTTSTSSAPAGSSSGSTAPPAGASTGTSATPPGGSAPPASPTGN